jgi:hypothetical protein
MERKFPRRKHNGNALDVPPRRHAYTTTERSMSTDNAQTKSTDAREAWQEKASTLILACGKAQRDAIATGVLHTYIKALDALTEHLRTTPEGYALVPVEWTDEQQESAQELLDTLRNSLGSAMSDTTMIGCIYDGMTAPYRKTAAATKGAE